MPSLKERLTELLIDNKLITQEQLEEALKLQKDRGGSLGRILIELKFIKEAELMSSLSEGLGFPLIDLKRVKLDLELVKTIPADIARRYQIIPVSRMADTVTLAMADPLNIFAIDHVGSLTGYKINPIISSIQDITQAIDSAYPDNTGGVIDDLVKEISNTSIELVKESEEAQFNDQELNRAGFQAPAIKLVNMILEEGVRKKSSDILIEPFDKKMRIRIRIDGILREEQSPPKNMHPNIVSRLKVIANLDIAEHRLPQDGRFKAKILGKEVDFRLSILPASYGEKVAIRILDKSQATLDITKLGFSEDTISKLTKVSKLPHGMILACGPTGSGKTTTLYSLLKYVDSPDKNIVTVEDPVEFQLEGINQVTVHPDIGLTFASALRAILRQDPNIIMIGEIRDYDTVDIAIKSALTGHLVLSTLHTTTACGAVVRLINMGVDPYLINASLVCVVAQRLMRKICAHCKEEFLLKEDVLNNLKLPAVQLKDAHFYRGKGCQKCFNTGYSGRIGISEVLLVSQSIHELVLKRSQEHIIKQLARKEGMTTLREEGVSNALKGITSIEEVLRVTASDE